VAADALTLTICFVTEGLPFTGTAISDQVLGGSESAVWFMAHELAKRGHRVDVFCRCPAPGDYSPPASECLRPGGCLRYWDVTDGRQFLIARDWDLLIVSRFYQYLTLPTRTRMRWYWMHDMPGDAQTLRNIVGHVYQTDQVMPLSQFHQEAYVKEWGGVKGFPALEPLCWQTRNGVDLSLIPQSAKTPRHPKRLLYASRPERGLVSLLTDIWPRLVKEDPELELVLCGYQVGNEMLPPEIQQLHAYCDEVLRHTPRVQKAGSLTKSQYYELLGSCAALVYPCLFPEISCINALEAMAVSTPVITSEAFALRETVPYDRVPGTPADPEYAEAFVAQTLRVLREPLYARRLKEHGRNWVTTRYQWRTIAREWEERALALFTQRQQTYGRRICEGLLYDSDVVAAHQLALAQGYTDLAETTQQILANHHTDPDVYFHEGLAETAWQSGPMAYFQHVLRLLPPPQDGVTLSILDVGCGMGAGAAFLARARPDVTVLGVDFSPKLIAAARAQTEQAGLTDRLFFEEGDALTLNPAPGRFPVDVVICCEVLEHTADYARLIAHWEGWCKENGLVLFTAPAGAWESYSYQEPSQAWNRQHIHHFWQCDLNDVFGAKQAFRLDYVPSHEGARGDLLGWWIVTYTNTPGASTGQIDYQRKTLTALPRPKIAACLIVKNEEDNLARCLKSFLDQVDEVWIWDCGSTDSTLAIAETFTHRYWPPVFLRHLDLNPDGDGLGNFGAWRNQSISETTADCILWIDADEVLTGARNLRKYASLSSLFNAYVIRQNHVMLGADAIPADEPQRLFRTGKGYRFFGMVHEQVAVSLNTPIAPCLLADDVDILHFGYLHREIQKRKCVERNLVLVKKDREMYPERELGPLLVMRDYLNLSQFTLEATGGRINDIVVQYLRKCVLLYLERFQDPDVQFHQRAYDIAQIALRRLALSGLPVQQEWGVPIEVKLALGIGVGGLRNELTPESRWFSGAQEFLDFMDRHTRRLVQPLLPPPPPLATTAAEPQPAHEAA